MALEEDKRILRERWEDFCKKSYPIMDTESYCALLWYSKENMPLLTAFRVYNRIPEVVHHFKTHLILPTTKPPGIPTNPHPAHT